MKARKAKRPVRKGEVSPSIKSDEPGNYNLASIASWQPQDLSRDTLGKALSELGENADGLIALYDAYTLAAEAFLSVENQPRAEDVEDFIEAERCRMLDNAFHVAARLASMKSVEEYRIERRAQTLFNCALEMGFALPAATVVLVEAAAVRAIPYKPAGA